MSDLTIFGQTFTDVKGIKATDTDGNEVVYGAGGINEYFTYLEDVTIHSDQSNGRGYLSSSWDFLTTEVGAWLLMGKEPNANGSVILIAHRRAEKETGWDYYIKPSNFTNFSVWGTNYNLELMDSRFFVTGNYGQDNAYGVYKFNEWI